MLQRFIVPVSLLLTSLGSAQAATEPVELAARFATTICVKPCRAPETRQWLFWRGANRVEIRDATNALGEVWKRDNAGRVSYTYLEPAHRRGIEYTPADLDIIQHGRPWEVLSGIVSPALLAKLALARETKVMGHEAKVFKGRQGDKQLEVVWLPGLQLAAKVTVTVGNRRSVSELRGFLVDTDAPSATSDAQLADYQLVDFADIGDMETSPAAVWLRQAAAPGHKHHE